VDVVPGRDPGDPYESGVPPDVEASEARRYARLFEVFLKHRDVIPRITFWGLEDGQSWLNTNRRKHTDYPLLFDRNLRRKPAFDAVIGVLSR
jgi:endo-1,4-beta-xylanase